LVLSNLVLTDLMLSNLVLSNNEPSAGFSFKRRCRDFLATTQHKESKIELEV
jgi:hypothetical protein